MSSQGTWQEVYDVVRLIPSGRVMNYGQVAKLCSRPLTPRAVGRALHECPDDVPWHRVVNASGGCSTDALGGGAVGRQRSLLEAEGVAFAATGRLDIEGYRYTLDIEDVVEIIADEEDG